MRAGWASSLVAGLLLVLSVGCESSDGESSGSYWSGNSSESSGAGAAAGDAAPFSSFNWTYGGVNGSGAAASSVTLADLSFSSNMLQFRYVQDLSAWGLSSGNAGAICCLFVKNSAGRWVGGKFDWISSSRTSRSLSHVTSGYGGWSLAGVPNPCEAAFVIIDSGGTRRSNVVAGTWQR